jgi:hypothetical protein
MEKGNWPSFLMLPVGIFLLFIIILFCLPMASVAVSCTPISARICVGADDEAYVFINGNPIPEVTNYHGVSSAANIPCANVSAAYFNLSGNNVIAVRNYNSIAGFVWASWSLDITCFDGSHTYINSDDGNVDYFDQPTFVDPPPANDGGGLTWQHPDYDPVPAWTVPVPVTCTIAMWFMPAVDPLTGLTMNALSYNPCAGNNPGNPDQSPIGQTLFFRQEFSFMQPISIVKTINKNSFFLNETVTYCFNYTNPEPAPRTFMLWDTIPAVTDFIGCNSGCNTQTFGSDVVVSWSINVPAGGSGSVCMWVGANRFPMSGKKKVLAAMNRKQDGNAGEL